MTEERGGERALLLGEGVFIHDWRFSSAMSAIIRAKVCMYSELLLGNCFAM